MKLSDKIQLLRRKYGYSQELLAEKCNVSRQAISKWESDIALPEPEKLIILSNLFNVSVDELLKDEIEINGLAEYRNGNAEISPPKKPRATESAKKKKKNIFVNILIAIAFMGVIFGGSFLIFDGIHKLNIIHQGNKSTISASAEIQHDDNKILEDLEKELIIAKDNINKKKAELNEERDAKQIEHDKLQQKEIKEFRKNGFSAKYYEIKRAEDKCSEEKLKIETQIRDLDLSSFFSGDDEIKELVFAKETLEKQIDEIKNPSPVYNFPEFPVKKFDWNKFKAIVEVILGSLIILILTQRIVAIYNKIIKSMTNVDNAFANIDVYLKKRWDLIPNIVESVKGYAAYESGTLQDVTRLRQYNYSDLGINEKVALNNELSRSISQILVLQERYPDLKANRNYLDLSHQLALIEEQIANSRVRYNNAVMQYNNTLRVFPNNILIRFLSNQEMKMFSMAEEEKENVTVK